MSLGTSLLLTVLFWRFFSWLQIQITPSEFILETSVCSCICVSSFQSPLRRSGTDCWERQCVVSSLPAGSRPQNQSGREPSRRCCAQVRLYFTTLTAQREQLGGNGVKIPTH